MVRIITLPYGYGGYKGIAVHRHIYMAKNKIYSYIKRSGKKESSLTLKLSPHPPTTSAMSRDETLHFGVYIMLSWKHPTCCAVYREPPMRLSGYNQSNII